MISHKAVKGIFATQGFTGPVSPKVTMRINETLAAFTTVSVAKPANKVSKGGGPVLPLNYFGLEGSGYYDGTPAFTDMSATSGFIRPALQSTAFGPFNGGRAGDQADDRVTALILKPMEKMVNETAQRYGRNLDVQQRSRMLARYVGLLVKAVQRTIERAAKNGMSTVDVDLFEASITIKALKMLH